VGLSLSWIYSKRCLAKEITKMADTATDMVIRECATWEQVMNVVTCGYPDNTVFEVFLGSILINGQFMGTITKSEEGYTVLLV
jgi:hypothetical protein